MSNSHWKLSVQTFQCKLHYMLREFSVNCILFIRLTNNEAFFENVPCRLSQEWLVLIAFHMLPLGVDS